MMTVMPTTTTSTTQVTTTAAMLALPLEAHTTTGAPLPPVFVHQVSARNLRYGAVANQFRT